MMRPAAAKASIASWVASSSTMPALISARTASAAAAARIASEAAIASAARISASIARSVASTSAACAAAITSTASSIAATSAPTISPASAVRKPSPSNSPPVSAIASNSGCAQPCSMSRNASAVPGSRECASASASVGSNPAEPAAVRSTTPAPPKGTIFDSSAPKSSSPMTVRSIVPSSLFETNSRSSSRRTPRPCRRSTSANTRPWKSAPGPKLKAITCKGPGICRPP